MTHQSPLSNIETFQNELGKSIRAHGRAEAQGSASRPAVGIALTAAAYDGYIDEDYAAKAYEDYAAGMAQVAGKNPLADNPASLKAQVTKFRAFIKAGMLPAIDAREVLERTMTRHAAHKAADTPVESPFQSLYNVCVEQTKQPDIPLTDDQIDNRIMKPEKSDKTDLDRVIAAYKAAHKLATDLPTPSIVNARDQYHDAILEMGGDVPPMTKEEKEHAAFMKKAEEMGFQQAPLMIAAQ